MDEDLKTTETDGPVESEAEFVMQSDYEYLMGSLATIDTIETLDTAMLSQRQQTATRKAKRQAIDIMCYMIDTWHQELFEKDDE